MKQTLRTLFSPILNILESGTEPFDYKPLNRKLLVVMGSLFLGLAIAVGLVAQGEDLAYLIPVAVFGGLGLLSLLVGLLGNDRAVAKIWGSR